METKPPFAKLLQTADRLTAADARSGGSNKKRLSLLLIFSPCVCFTFTRFLHLIFFFFLLACLHCRCRQYRCPEKLMTMLPSLATPHTAACSGAAPLDRIVTSRSLRPPAESSMHQTVFMSPPPLNPHPKFYPLEPSREPHSNIRVSVLILSSTLLQNRIHSIQTQMLSSNLHLKIK